MMKIKPNKAKVSGIALTIVAVLAMAGGIMVKRTSHQGLEKYAHKISIPDQDTMVTLERIKHVAARVEEVVGDEEAFICYKDCLYQWKEGDLFETIAAWSKYVRRKKEGDTVLYTRRNGLLVPMLYRDYTR